MFLIMKSKYLYIYINYNKIFMKILYALKFLNFCSTAFFLELLILSRVYLYYTALLFKVELQ